jgi:hypothetical protein
MVGHGAHMPVRAAGSHHQAVGHGAFALEIDENNVLGLVVVQLGQDQVFQGGDTAMGIQGGFGVR